MKIGRIFSGTIYRSFSDIQYYKILHFTFIRRRLGPRSRKLFCILFLIILKIKKTQFPEIHSFDFKIILKSFTLL